MTDYEHPATSQGFTEVVRENKDSVFYKWDHIKRSSKFPSKLHWLTVIDLDGYSFMNLPLPPDMSSQLINELVLEVCNINDYKFEQGTKFGIKLQRERVLEALGIGAEQYESGPRSVK